VCSLPALSHSRSSGLEAVRRATTRCAEEGLVRAEGRVGENGRGGGGWSGVRGQAGEGGLEHLRPADEKLASSFR
jgi:hypothetical protein